MRETLTLNREGMVQGNSLGMAYMYRKFENSLNKHANKKRKIKNLWEIL